MSEGLQGLKGLRGLRGFSDLSDGERAKFLRANASKLSQYSNNPLKYGVAAEILYNNRKFIDKFGEEVFNRFNDGTDYSYNLRNQLFRENTINTAFQDKFKNYSNFNVMNNELDTDGKYALMTNNEFVGEIERKKRLQAGIDYAKKEGKQYDKMYKGTGWFVSDASTAGFSAVAKQQSAQSPFDKDKEYAENDQEILDKLYAETQQRRESTIQEDADRVYADILEADAVGKKSLKQELKEFENIAMNEGQGYYATFKNSKWLKGYTDEDKLKDYAKYKALKNNYGEGIARAYLMRSMQDKVAEAQDGKWTGNTLKGLLTTMWSDLGANVSTIAHLGSTVDRLSILNQGKDPDKPIYDKKGNIIDYEKDENWFTNPAYWNNVYKYNTFSPTEINAIQERGGVSEDVNVRAFGYTPDFLSWDTAEEGFKQGGHIIEGIAETALLGGFGKAASWTGKGLLSTLGASSKVMNVMSKAGKITNNLFVAASTGIAGSQLEAMGTFDDQLQSAKEKIQDQINKELVDYQQSINYDNKSSKNAIRSYYNQLKRQDNRRVALESKDGIKASPTSDEVLMEQAKQMYTNQLLEVKQKELEQLHKKDEMEAAIAALFILFTSSEVMDDFNPLSLSSRVSQKGTPSM